MRGNRIRGIPVAVAGKPVLRSIRGGWGGGGAKQNAEIPTCGEGEVSGACHDPEMVSTSEGGLARNRLHQA